MSDGRRRLLVGVSVAVLVLSVLLATGALLFFVLGGLPRLIGSVKPASPGLLVAPDAGADLPD